MSLLVRLCLVVFALSGIAHAAQPVTLETIMADPDWIGNQPERPFWSDDGLYVHYEQKRTGETIRDQFRVSVGSQVIERVDGAAMPKTANASRAFNQTRDAVVWISHGDVFVRELPNGVVRQLTSTAAPTGDAKFVVGRNAVTYTKGDQYFLHDLETGGVTQLLDVKFAADPNADKGFDTLRANQQRIYTDIVEDQRRKDVAREHRLAQQRARPGSAPLPLYLGKDQQRVVQSLSPDAQHLVLITRAAGDNAGKKGIMPNYMTASGYTETRELRERVGRNIPPTHTAWLIDINANTAMQLSLDDLPGIDKDPLAALRKSALSWHTERGADKAAVEKALKAPEQRGVYIYGVDWSDDGRIAAMQLFASDNKDRWIVTVNTDEDEKALRSQHRLTDTAWINYAHNDFGWLPDNRLWLLSEESGYSQLYTKSLSARKHRALTKGEFVVSDVALTPDGTSLTFRSNKVHPSTWEIFSVPADGGELRQLTALGGVNEFNVSPSGEALAVRHSEFDKHPDLYHVRIADGMATQLTDTRTDAYKAYDWVIPDIVEVPSSHVDRPIYTKLYLPRDYDAEKTYPAVMFVHGAGYTQNSHAGWPYYFREFMFHTLLAERGVIVIDMDYRASKGYGRDWRTAIYRQMGHPELEDFQDGVQWAVDNYNVDPGRVGVYGGSYGGFMAFMALFRDPDLFAAGAALRPVVDWAHYNHGYTSNILNTPLIDPEAYEKSSPIFFADGLDKPLLIAAGMQDDNVFFQDSVLLVQRLIELQKEDFELAVYPLDPHGFTHADSWLDEYRRVLKLMEQHVIAP
ncbi:MAG: alpha/beta fold hydrolase [Pseudomonadota bacterium]